MKMAGNTKLIGFGPGSTIELQRWGEKVQVKLELESIKALRAACYDQLPKKPPERLGSMEDFDVFYDESVGRVTLSLSPDMAKKISDVMAPLDILMSAVAKELAVAHQAHLDYINVDEPGVPK
jgi:hypothetical protein